MLATDLPKGSTLSCHYAREWSKDEGFAGAPDPQHAAATRRIHDARGCVPTCEHCARWRAGLSHREGHGDTCPEGGALA